jgi:hypothetical protein
MGTNRCKESDIEKIKSEYVGMEYSTFIITQFVGRYCEGSSKYERNFFEKECKCCGYKKVINTSKIKHEIKENTSCFKCNGAINIHTKEKKCIGCHQWFPATSEYFHKNESEKRKSHFGLYYYCKTCNNEKNRIRKKKYRLENPIQRKPNGSIRHGKLETTIKTDSDKLKKEFLGLEYGSFVVTRYIGRYPVGNSPHDRHHFERECKFCGVKATLPISHIKRSIKKEAKCCLCKETLNIHTKEKRCNSCEQWLPATNRYFPLSKNRPFGIHYYCFPCHNKKGQKRRGLKENRDKEYAQKKLRSETDIIFKMSCRLRTHIKNYINDNRSKLPGQKRKHGKSAMVEVLGGDYQFFKEWIENKFTEGMTWDNYGEWHYEHLIPLSYAETVDELYELCHHTNYRPMWGSENGSKSNKLYIDEIPEENKIRYAKFIDRYINNPKYVRYSE